MKFRVGEHSKPFGLQIGHRRDLENHAKFGIFRQFELVRHAIFVLIFGIIFILLLLQSEQISADPTTLPLGHSRKGHKLHSVLLLGIIRLLVVKRQDNFGISGIIIDGWTQRAEVCKNFEMMYMRQTLRE